MRGTARAHRGRDRERQRAGRTAAGPEPAMSAPRASLPSAPADGVAATYRARQMLARAHWAAGAFAQYDRASVLRIAEAAARAAHAEARRYAEWAVKETGFGV